LLAGNPDPIPKKIFRKKKTHGKTDARALAGTEFVEREHAAREAALTANAVRKKAGVTPPGTPPRAGESHDRDTPETLPRASAPGTNTAHRTIP
jgi:hypothetical protein